MFFRKNKPKTYMEIQIDAKKTEISIYEKHGSIRGNSISLDYGFKDVLEKSYEEARFFDEEIGEMSLESFLESHYDKAYSNIKSFISRIEFSILCKMKLPSKIERIYLKGIGSELFVRELKSTFLNCYI